MKTAAAAKFSWLWVLLLQSWGEDGLVGRVRTGMWSHDGLGRLVGWLGARTERKREPVEKAREGLFFLPGGHRFLEKYFYVKIRIRLVDVVVRTLCWVKLEISPKIGKKWLCLCLQKFCEGQVKGNSRWLTKKLTFLPHDFARIFVLFLRSNGSEK